MSYTCLSKRIINAIDKSCPISLNGVSLRNPNVVFSLKNPYILEAIPDKFINSKSLTELSKLEGRNLNEVRPILDSFEKSGAKVGLKSINKTKVNLYERLAEFYEKTAQKKIKSGNTTSAQIYKDFANKVRNKEITEKELYEKLYTELYNNIRLADYPITAAWNHKIADVTGKSNSYIMLQECEGWHYRIPKRRHEFGWSRNGKAIDRISVNANTDSELIAKLDEYFGTGKAKGYYKTPAYASAWLERHDPITIYLHEKANPQILKDIENITKNHIRSTENVLVGSVFAPGLALEKSPSYSDVKKLLDEISNINPVAGEAVKDELIGNLVRKGLPKDSQFFASSGQITAMKMLLEMLR